MSLFDDGEVVFRVEKGEVTNHGYEGNWFREESYSRGNRIIVIPSDEGEKNVKLNFTDRTAEAVINEQQIDHVTALMEELQPDMVSDLIDIFVANVNDLEEVQASKHIHRSAFLNATRSTIKHTHIGNLIWDEENETLSVNGNKVITGAPRFVLMWIMKEMPGKYRQAVQLFKYLQHGSPKLKELNLENALTEFRNLRAESRSLDMISKIDQDVYLSEDNQCFNFGTPVPDVDNVYWFSLDADKPDAPWPIQTVQDVKTLKLEDFHQVGENDMVLARLTRGDHIGANSNDNKMLKRLYRLHTETNCGVRVELYHDKTIQGVRGYLFHKPRPHNMVGIYDLDGNGAELCQLFQNAEQGIIKANIERNKRYFDHSYKAQEKTLFNTPLYITQTVSRRVKYQREIEQGKLKKKKIPPHAQKQSERVQRFQQICRDKNSHQTMVNENWPYAHVEGPYHKRFIFHCLDYGTAEMSFRSICEWASREGKRVVYDGWEWVIRG